MKRYLYQTPSAVRREIVEGGAAKGIWHRKGFLRFQLAVARAIADPTQADDANYLVPSRLAEPPVRGQGQRACRAKDESSENLNIRAEQPQTRRGSVLLLKKR